MSDSSNSAGGGLGFAGALTLLFIGLELGGVIAWSWWWVIAPLWISAGLGLLLLIVVVIVAAITA